VSQLPQVQKDAIEKTIYLKHTRKPNIKFAHDYNRFTLSLKTNEQTTIVRIIYSSIYCLAISERISLSGWHQEPMLRLKEHWTIWPCCRAT